MSDANALENLEQENEQAIKDLAEHPPNEVVVKKTSSVGFTTPSGFEIIIHQVEQGTEEWFAVRKGKMTASHAQAIGNCGKGLDTYIDEVVAEKFATAREEGYSNEWMERGKELEDQARSMYELKNSVTVRQVGFIERDECTGCSPDGLVEEEGGLEVKVKKNTVHAKVIREGIKGVDSKDIWQCNMNMLVTGRKWWDYVMYNPNYPQNLLIFRITPDKEKFAALEKGLAIGKGKIEALSKLMQ